MNGTARESDPSLLPDLRECEREPIHIPGFIEPHGVLLVLTEPGLVIVQISANTQAVLGLSPDVLLGMRLQEVLAEPAIRFLQLNILPQNLEGKRHYLGALSLVVSPGLFEGLVHRQQGLLLLELEPSSREATTSAVEIQAVLSRVLNELDGPHTLSALCRLVAQQVRRFTGFDRVMVYRFLEDDSGEVIAEDRREDLLPYLGLRYPASDIPAQARRLYVLNTLRLKPDVNAQRVPLVPTRNPLTGEPLDMSYCVLRAMSPVHDEYLRNMGVAASMSISVLQDGRLWGLVACHHSTPHSVPQQVRLNCEVLARVFATHLAAAEYEEQRLYAERLRQAQEELAQRLRARSDVSAILAETHTGLFHDFHAHGAAVSLQGHLSLFGQAPRQEEVQQLLDWLLAHQDQPVYGTAQLAAAYPESARFLSSATGLLSARLTRDGPDFLLWFRPEVLQVVAWSGRPDQPAEVTEDGKRISPRRSFERWEETMRGRSEPWLPVEWEFARSVRLLVAEALLDQQNREVARLNAELSRSNVELEAFAYAAAHDLQEPLRAIRSYAQLLHRRAGTRLDQDSREFLSFIETGAERMSSLIRGLLGYSQLGGRERLTRQATPMADVLRWTLVNLAEALRESGGAVGYGELPIVSADPQLMGQLLQNLIGNALKYRRPEQTPEIHVGAVKEAGFWHFSVRDNGQGFLPEKAEDIFRVFTRLHGREVPGSGIGLATCKRIVESHGGRIWAESEPGHGSLFHFTLPADPE